MSDRDPASVGLFEALYTMRALRRFTDEPVSDEVLFQVLDAAIRAPSGGNSQTWHFLIVRDEEKRRRIGEMYLAAWNMTSYQRDYLDIPSAFEQLPRQQQRVFVSARDLALHIGEVPVLLFVCGDPRAAGSIFPAVQNALLACRGLGLGSVVTSIHRAHEAELRELLTIPDGTVAHALLPIGWPRDRIGPVSRAPVKEHASLDGFGEPWPYAQSQPDEGLRSRWV